MKRGGVRSGIVAGTAVAVAVLTIVSGAAARNVPPATVLHVGGFSQRGGLVWEEWTSPSGNGCVQSSGDGTQRYPRRIRVSPGPHSARFLLTRRQRPSTVRITAWHELDPNGQQTGPSEVLPWTLHPRGDASGKRAGWAARFSVNVPPSYFIRLYVRWPDGECGGPRHVLRTYALGPQG